MSRQSSESTSRRFPLRLQGERRPEARSGFSIVELLIALTVLLIALVGFSQAIVGAGGLATASRENAWANEAARSIIEELQATPFEEVFLSYNDFTGDDVGVEPGPNFEVRELEASSDDPDGIVGRIVFPVDPTDPSVLLEDLGTQSANAPFGLPRDLNGDDMVDLMNHALDYELLPVIVRVEWRNGLLEVRTILTDMR